jgi:hypothetical protein
MGLSDLKQQEFSSAVFFGRSSCASWKVAWPLG